MIGDDSGQSLGRRAWRRLRRDRAAMVSLAVLSAVGLAAALTPLLPLQAPDHIQTALQYAEPTASPLWIKGFAFDAERVAKSRRDIARLREELTALQRSPDATNERLARKRAEINDALYAPYLQAGFAEVGPISRWMIRTRHALFAERQVNSLFGRDLLGRDVLSRVFWGARISIIVGLVATGVSLIIGVTYGAVSGYAGGWLDDAMMRTVDVLYSIPFIFVVIFIITILNADEVAQRMAFYGISKITVFYIVVGAIYWLTMARVVRGQIITLKTESFVEAAQALGASQGRILFRHLLPNIAGVVLVYLTLTIPRVMLFEAFLSFLGLGVEPPDVSWGLLAKEGLEVLTPVKVYWWLVLFPSAAIGATLLALNFLGDGLRDALDPRTAER